jgi:hypothetical protein
MLCRFTVFIPLRYNDGMPIEPEVITTILKEISGIFGGWTRSPHLGFPVSEGWYMEEGKPPYHDEHTVITIDASDEKLPEIQRLKARWEPVLLQRYLYITYQPITVVTDPLTACPIEERVSLSLQAFVETLKARYQCEPSDKQIEDQRKELYEFFKGTGLYRKRSKSQ